MDLPRPAPLLDDVDIEYQFAAFSIEATETTPQKRLLVAILQRAIRDFIGIDAWGEGERIQEESESWLFDSDTDENEMFSFLYICQQLDFAPDRLRHEVRNLTQEVRFKLYEVSVH